MKNILFILFFIFTSTVAEATPNRRLAFGKLSCKLIQQCTPSGAATSGTQTRSNCSFAFNGCTGFTCSPGYDIFGSTCRRQANVICSGGSYCAQHPNASTLTVGTSMNLYWNNGSTCAVNFNSITSRWYCTSFPANGTYYTDSSCSVGAMTRLNYGQAPNGSQNFCTQVD